MKVPTKSLTAIPTILAVVAAIALGVGNSAHAAGHGSRGGALKDSSTPSTVAPYVYSPPAYNYVPRSYTYTPPSAVAPPAQ